MAEVLRANLKDIEDEYEHGFVGMTEDEAPLAGGSEVLPAVKPVIAATRADMSRGSAMADPSPFAAGRPKVWFWTGWRINRINGRLQAAISILGDKPGNAIAVSAWNTFLPASLLNGSFGGT